MADEFDFSSITKSDVGGLLGGLLGAASSGDSTKTQTQNNDPWAAAQPWMKANLAQGQQLQDYYQKNPFSDGQKTAYQNLFSGVDNFNQSIAPSLMGMAQNGMNTGYQRNTGGAVGSGGYGGGGGSMVANGNHAVMTAAPSQAIGQIDWAKLNPYTNGGISAPVATANPIAQPVTAPGLLSGGTTGSGGSGGGYNGGSNGYGDFGPSDGSGLSGFPGGFSTLDGTNSKQVGWGTEGQLAGGLLGGPIGAFIGKLIGANIKTNEYNGYGTLDGTSTPDPGPGWSDAMDRYSMSPTMSVADQNAAAALNGYGSYGSGGGGFGGNTAGPGGGFGANGVSGGFGGGGGGFA